MGNIRIDDDVNVLFRQAVTSEMAAMGFQLDDPARVLSGDLIEITCNDLGFSIDWTLKVRYRLHAGEGASLVYEGEKTIKRTTEKNRFSFYLSELIRLNLESVVTDPAFVVALGK